METSTAWPRTIEYYLPTCLPAHGALSHAALYYEYVLCGSCCTGRTTQHFKHAGSEVLPVCTRITAHPSRPADSRREPALKRPGPGRDTARPRRRIEAKHKDRAMPATDPSPPPLLEPCGSRLDCVLLQA
ncbi:hypothetical protein TgHK011_001911 [Trichoderma gracile]|nr:hypothetical protein TgHK011_001911 [Trichoderma gracile]